MRRGRPAWLFLGLVVLGTLWPVLAGAVSCGDCCGSRTSACGKPPAAGFSLCCFNSISTLPAPPFSGFALACISPFTPVEEAGELSPFSRDILHVPRSS